VQTGSELDLFFRAYSYQDFVDDKPEVMDTCDVLSEESQEFLTRLMGFLDASVKRQKERWMRQFLELMPDELVTFSLFRGCYPNLSKFLERYTFDSVMREVEGDVAHLLKKFNVHQADASTILELHRKYHAREKVRKRERELAGWNQEFQKCMARVEELKIRLKELVLNTD
jgi:hypothetical protein